MEESYNKILRNTRVGQNLSIESVANKLKIRADIVNTLEEGDFEHLPSTGFTRNMVFSYARLLGLDGAALSKQYLAESDAYFARKKGLISPSGAPRRPRNTSSRTSRSSRFSGRFSRGKQQEAPVDSTEVSKDPAVADAASSTWTAPSFYEPNELEPKQIQSFGHVSTREGFGSPRRYGSSASRPQSGSRRPYSDRAQSRASQRNRVAEPAVGFDDQFSSQAPVRESRQANRLRQRTAAVPEEIPVQRPARQGYSRFNNRASYDMRNEGYSGANDPSFDARRPSAINRQKAISSSKDQKSLGVVDKMNSLLPNFNISKKNLSIGLIIAVALLVLIIVLNMTVCAPKADVDKLSNVPISGLTDVEQKTS